MPENKGQHTNGWLREFFSKNAYAIIVAMIGLVGTIFVMRHDVSAVIETASAIPTIQQKLSAQDEINKEWDRYMQESNRRFDRIENKLDRALQRR